MIAFQNYRKYLLLTLSYYFVALSVLLVVLYFKGKLNIINNQTFINWDAAHYYFVKNNGYDFANTAFFPLFPFTWKLINLTPIGIGILNFSVFACSISLLCYELKLKNIQTFVVLSVPGLFFMLLPYAEAFFFVAGTLIIIGLKNKKMWLTLLGLFLCSLTRPTTFILIPAIIITLYLSYNVITKKEEWKKIILHSILYSSVLITGLLLSFIIHKLYTGQWFTFFESQKNWGNKLGFPSFPLRTWGGDNINRYDASAFFIGTSCAILILILLFKKKVTEKLNLPSYFIFCAAYLAGVVGVVFLYRGGLLFSLNRFVYATPFFVMAFAYFISKFSFTIKHTLILFFTTIIFWVLFNSYTHIHNFLSFAIVSVIFCLVLLSTNKNKTISISSMVLLILINNIVAYRLFSKFLHGFWVA